MNDFINELTILWKCDYPLIIGVQEALEDTDEINLIQDLCLGGDIYTLLKSRPAFSDLKAA